jgi:hypothetical protein
MRVAQTCSALHITFAGEGPGSGRAPRRCDFRTPIKNEGPNRVWLLRGCQSDSGHQDDACQSRIAPPKDQKTLDPVSKPRVQKKVP